MAGRISDEDLEKFFEMNDRRQQSIVERQQQMMQEEYDEEDMDMIQSGGGQESPYIPPTLSQEHLKFLDGNDEVPRDLLKPLWGLFTRHNSLTNISTPWDMNRIRTQVRAVTRVMMWEGKITLVQMVMIQRYVELQILKSQHQGERRLLAPWLQQITKVEEYAERPGRPGGFLSKGMGFLFGGGGRR